MRKQLTINWQNEMLAATVDYPETIQPGQKYPLIIICHGFIGSKVGVDRLFVKTAQELTQDGYIVLRFDYAGCGESTGHYGRTGLHDLIDQTKTVIDFSYRLQQVDHSKMILLGHSLGGATAVLTAAGDSRINRLILWSSVAHPYKDITTIVGREKVRSLHQTEKVDYLGYRFTKSFFHSLLGYEPLQEAVDFSGDVLIVHGTGDMDIPAGYANDYEKAFAKRDSGHVTRHEIAGANHTISDYDHFSELITATRHWIGNQFELPVADYQLG